MEKWVIKLVDDAGAVDEAIKSNKAKLEKMKLDLKDYARNNKLPVLSGESFEARLSRLTETGVLMMKLKKMLVDIHGADAINVLLTLVNPNVSAIREWMGKENIHESVLIKVVDSDSYGKIGFKRVKRAVRKRVTYAK